MGIIIKYLKETFAELHHVNWPKRQQTIIYTTLIVIISIVTGAFVGAFDWLFTNFVKLFV